jgi:hypothetical protein
MRILISCLFGLVIGIFIGGYLVATGESIAVDEIVSCIKDPGSCGIDEDDIQPTEELIPAMKVINAGN